MAYHLQNVLFWISSYSLPCPLPAQPPLNELGLAVIPRKSGEPLAECGRSGLVFAEIVLLRWPKRESECPLSIWGLWKAMLGLAVTEAGDCGRRIDESEESDWADL